MAAAGTAAGTTEAGMTAALDAATALGRSKIVVIMLKFVKSWMRSL